jgi:hypothetical protein
MGVQRIECFDGHRRPPIGEGAQRAGVALQVHRFQDQSWRRRLTRLSTRSGDVSDASTSQLSAGESTAMCNDPGPFHSTSIVAWAVTSQAGPQHRGQAMSSRGSPRPADASAGVSAGAA